MSLLNDDILHLVFEQAVADWENGSTSSIGCSPNWLQLTRFLSAVTGVCQQWRIVALKTPRLWRNLRLGPDSVPYYTRTYWPLALCLLRSGAVPLKIWLHGDLRTSCSSIFTSGMHRTAFSTIDRPLRMQLDPAERKRTFLPLFTVLSYRFAELQVLELNGMTGSLDRGMLTVLFSLAPRLVVLELVYVQARTATAFHLQHPVVLPHLRRLRLLDVTSQAVQDTLALVTCPELRCLTIAVDIGGDSDQDRPWEVATLFRVSRLEISGPLSEQDLTAICSFVPNAIFLRFFDCDMRFDDYDEDRGIVDPAILVGVITRLSLLPLLRDLQLDDCAPSDAQLFIEMTELRHLNVIQLSSGV